MDIYRKLSGVRSIQNKNLPQFLESSSDDESVESANEVEVQDRDWTDGNAVIEHGKVASGVPQQAPPDTADEFGHDSLLVDTYDNAADVEGGKVNESQPDGASPPRVQAPDSSKHLNEGRDASSEETQDDIALVDEDRGRGSDSDSQPDWSSSVQVQARSIEESGAGHSDANREKTYGEVVFEGSLGNDSQPASASPVEVQDHISLKDFDPSTLTEDATIQQQAVQEAVLSPDFEKLPRALVDSEQGGDGEKTEDVSTDATREMPANLEPDGSALLSGPGLANHTSTQELQAHVLTSKEEKVGVVEANLSGGVGDQKEGDLFSGSESNLVSDQLSKAFVNFEHQTPSEGVEGFQGMNASSTGINPAIVEPRDSAAPDTVELDDARALETLESYDSAALEKSDMVLALEFKNGTMTDSDSEQFLASLVNSNHGTTLRDGEGCEDAGTVDTGENPEVVVFSDSDDNKVSECDSLGAQGGLYGMNHSSHNDSPIEVPINLEGDTNQAHDFWLAVQEELQKEAFVGSNSEKSQEFDELEGLAIQVTDSDKFDSADEMFSKVDSNSNEGDQKASSESGDSFINALEHIEESSSFNGTTGFEEPKEGYSSGLVSTDAGQALVDPGQELPNEQTCIPDVHFAEEDESLDEEISQLHSNGDAGEGQNVSTTIEEKAERKADLARVSEQLDEALVAYKTNYEEAQDGEISSSDLSQFLEAILSFQQEQTGENDEVLQETSTVDCGKETGSFLSRNLTSQDFLVDTDYAPENLEEPQEKNVGSDSEPWSDLLLNYEQWRADEDSKGPEHVTTRTSVNNVKSELFDDSLSQTDSDRVAHAAEKQFSSDVSFPVQKQLALAVPDARDDDPSGNDDDGAAPVSEEFNDSVGSENSLMRAFDDEVDHVDVEDEKVDGMSTLDIQLNFEGESDGGENLNNQTDSVQNASLGNDNRHGDEANDGANLDSGLSEFLEAILSFDEEPTGGFEEEEEVSFPSSGENSDNVQSAASASQSELLVTDHRSEELPTDPATIQGVVSEGNDISAASDNLPELRITPGKEIATGGVKDSEHVVGSDSLAKVETVLSGSPPQISGGTVDSAERGFLRTVPSSLDEQPMSTVSDAVEEEFLSKNNLEKTGTPFEELCDRAENQNFQGVDFDENVSSGGLEDEKEDETPIPHFQFTSADESVGIENDYEEQFEEFMMDDVFTDSDRGTQNGANGASDSSQFSEVNDISETIQQLLTDRDDEGSEKGGKDMLEEDGEHFASTSSASEIQGGHAFDATEEQSQVNLSNSTEDQSSSDLQNAGEKSLSTSCYSEVTPIAFEEINATSATQNSPESTLDETVDPVGLDYLDLQQLPEDFLNSELEKGGGDHGDSAGSEIFVGKSETVQSNSSKSQVSDDAGKSFPGDVPSNIEVLPITAMPEGDPCKSDPPTDSPHTIFQECDEGSHIQKALQNAIDEKVDPTDLEVEKEDQTSRPDFEFAPTSQGDGSANGINLSLKTLTLEFEDKLKNDVQQGFNEDEDLSQFLEAIVDFELQTTGEDGVLEEGVSSDAYGEELNILKSHGSLSKSGLVVTDRDIDDLTPLMVHTTSEGVHGEGKSFPEMVQREENKQAAILRDSEQFPDPPVNLEQKNVGGADEGPETIVTPETLGENESSHDMHTMDEQSPLKVSSSISPLVDDPSQNHAGDFATKADFRDANESFGIQNFQEDEQVNSVDLEVSQEGQIPKSDPSKIFGETQSGLATYTEDEQSPLEIASTILALADVGDNDPSGAPVGNFATETGFRQFNENDGIQNSRKIEQVDSVDSETSREKQIPKRDPSQTFEEIKSGQAMYSENEHFPLEVPTTISALADVGDNDSPGAAIGNFASETDFRHLDEIAEIQNSQENEQVNLEASREKQIPKPDPPETFREMESGHAIFTTDMQSLEVSSNTSAWADVVDNDTSRARAGNVSTETGSREINEIAGVQNFQENEQVDSEEFEPSKEDQSSKTDRTETHGKYEGSHVINTGDEQSPLKVSSTISVQADFGNKAHARNLATETGFREFNEIAGSLKSLEAEQVDAEDSKASRDRQIPKPEPVGNENDKNQMQFLQTTGLEQEDRSQLDSDSFQNLGSIGDDEGIEGMGSDASGETDIFNLRSPVSQSGVGTYNDVPSMNASIDMAGILSEENDTWETFQQQIRLEGNAWSDSEIFSEELMECEPGDNASEHFSTDTSVKGVKNVRWRHPLSQIGRARADVVVDGEYPLAISSTIDKKFISAMTDPEIYDPSTAAGEKGSLSEQYEDSGRNVSSTDASGACEEYNDSAATQNVNFDAQKDERVPKPDADFDSADETDGYKIYNHQLGETDPLPDGGSSSATRIDTTLRVPTAVTAEEPFKVGANWISRDAAFDEKDKNVESVDVEVTKGVKSPILESSILAGLIDALDSGPGYVGTSPLLLRPLQAGIPFCQHVPAWPWSLLRKFRGHPAHVSGFSHKSPEGLEEVRISLHAIKVKLLRLALRLGQSPHHAPVNQVLYRLGLADQLICGQMNNHGALKFENASEKAAKDEAAGLEDFDFTCTIMLLGKTGVGKSATLNSIFGEMKAGTNAFRPCTEKVEVITGDVYGVKMRVIDTPGLSTSVKDQRQNEKIMASVKAFTKKQCPDIVLYCDRLDMQCRDRADLPVLRTITQTFGASMWLNTIVVLTHASSAPPDSPNSLPIRYDRIVEQRSHVVQQTIRQAAGDTRLMNLVSVVDNHEASRINQTNLQMQRNGKVWKPQLLMNCFASKILAEANTLLKLPANIANKTFGTRPELPPLPFLLSSLLHSRALKFLDEQVSDEDETDYQVVEEKDSEMDEDYQSFPLFRRVAAPRLPKLDVDIKGKNSRRMDWIETLFRKMEWKDELSSRKLSRTRIVHPHSNQLQFVDDMQLFALNPAPMSDIALPLSFDSANPTYRYRFCEATNHWIVHPFVETRRWDHDNGYDGMSVETLFAIGNNIPASVSGTITNDRKRSNLNIDCAASLKHKGGKMTRACLDIESVGTDVAYTMRSETRFNDYNRSNTTGGLALTSLGDAISAGVKIEDTTMVGKRAKLTMSCGAVTHLSEIAYGGSLEATLRDKQYPLTRNRLTLGVSMMDCHGYIAVGGSLQSQAMFGKSLVAGRARFNHKGTGQICIRASSSEYTQMVLVGLLPIFRVLVGHFFSYQSDM